MHEFIKNIVYFHKKKLLSLCLHVQKILIREYYKFCNCIMYTDLSLIPTNFIELLHLIKSLKEQAITSAAIDYQFTDTLITPIPDSFNKLKQSQGQIQFYSRATLIIEQNSTLHQLNQFPNNNYDLIAVRPKNQKIFHALCIEYDNYDIISLDLSNKLPFMLKRNPVYQALRRQKYFQLQCSPLLDDQSRVICLTNFINVIKATGGKNLIVSTHANSLQNHRTPYDIAALLSSLGLSKNVALATMKQNAEKLLKIAIHRKFFKGTIKELPHPIVKKLSKKIQKHRQNIKNLIKQKDIIEQI